ncbi:MAG: hypothetical protein WD492_15425 [Alkalispirochaeta sp.]
MSEPTSNKAGGRVFRIDRECYVIYVGSDDHRVRPFLRVGTSPNFPDRIRPYIGTVVLSDRVTGNPLQEAETVGAVGPRRPEYTGSPELVHAFSPLTGMDRVRERPILSSDRQLPQGAFVEFLTDGNLHLTVNGHRIYDLDEVEQNDRHGAYLLDRVVSAIRSSGGIYDAEVFGPAGFLVGTDRSVFRFSQGTLTATALQSGAVEALARRLIDPELLAATAGPADPEELLRWGKWRLRRVLLSGSSQPVVIARDPSSSEAPRRLDHLLEVLRVAGVPVERAPVSREFDLPQIPGEPAPTTLRVSSRGEWPTIPSRIVGGTVPVVPGVPYRVFSGVDALPQGKAAGADPKELDRERDDAYGTLMSLLHSWNTDALGLEETKPENFSQRAAELLAACPAPVWADLYPSGEGYSVRFMVQHGFSLKYARENIAAVERIDSALEDRVPPGEIFRGEQRRLLAFLDELLEQRRATTRPPVATSPAATPAAANPTAAPPTAPEDGVESVEEGSPADQSRGGAQNPNPQEPAERPAASVAASGVESSNPSAAKRTKGGAGAAGASPGGGSDGPSRSPRSRGGRSFSESSRRGWRGPTFVVVGVVLIAGAVALLLWRDDTGERYLARLGSRSETALVADDDAGGASNDDGAANDRDDVARDDATTDSDDGAANDDGGGATNGGAANDPDAAGDPEETDDGTATDAPIIVTETDILRMVNRIAELNDYAPIGSMAPDARDPNWIFPGNQLKLPNQELYEIRRGDTMWAISDRFIRQSAQEHMWTLTSLSERIQRGERPVNQLRVLLEETYVETTRRRAGELLSEIGVE